MVIAVIRTTPRSVALAFIRIPTVIVIVDPEAEDLTLLRLHDIRVVDFSVTVIIRNKTRIAKDV